MVQKVIRLADLTPPQRELVRALMAQKKAAPAVEKPGAAQETDDGVRRLPPAA